MSEWGHLDRVALDRHITGHYGEDQFRDDDPDEEDYEEPEPDLSGCPYYALFHGLPGHDPHAVCDRGCYSEPACITDEPREGWPSVRARKGDS